MNNVKIKKRLELDDILSVFEPKIEQRVGIEYERLPIFSKTLESADYGSESGICEVLRSFAREDGWDYITDDDNIIGLKQIHDTLTLEPGCQLELSLEPQKNIVAIEKKINEIDKKLKPILKQYGLKMLGYGVSPVSTYKSIQLIPKKRYHLMAKYLWGILSDVMMRETAGVQACFDFHSEEDAVRKFKLANKLSPFMTAMFANSPIRGGVETGYKTFRALSWLNTDNERCGFACNLEKEFSFKSYIDKVLKSPMIFVNREDSPIAMNGKLNFHDFLNKGYEGFEPTMEDFQLHANLYFPEVRLRNFIEIRNHDCVNHKMQYAILAIYKGILYSESAMDDIEMLLSELSQSDIAELRYNVPKNALSARIKSKTAGDYAKEILSIAGKSLKEIGEGEEKYLDSIKELTLKGLSPADVILKNWHGSWNKDINKLIKHVEV